MFVSACIAEIKDKGFATIGWQQQVNGEQVNCFHKFDSHRAIEGHVQGLSGLECLEILRPIGEENSIFFC
jgi:hypothetical protein